MVYARYIRKGKKTFGPYYYKNVRDKDGKVRNVFIGTKPPVDYFVRPYYKRSRFPKSPMIKAGLFLAVMVVVFFGFSYTSFFIAREAVYTQAINIGTAENITYQWSPENQGNITSFRISGSFTGNGTVRVWLKTKEKAYLVFDSSKLELMNFTAEESPVTGFQILEQETNASEITTENLTANTTENIPENLTQLPEIVPEEEANITSELNISEETITENVTPEENVTGIAGNLTNETSVSIQQPQPIPKEIIYKFYESCMETCSIGLSDKEYTLEIEIENGTVLNIDNAVYTVSEKRANRPPVLLKDIPDMTIYPGGNATINLSEYFLDPDGDPLEFSFIAEEQLTVSIDSGIATIKTDPNFGGDSKLVFLASDMEEKTRGNEITIYIRKVNRPPEGRVPDQVMDMNSSLKLELSKYFSDPDGDKLTYEVLPNENLGLELKGDKLSVLASDQEGLFAIVLNVSDGKGFMLSEFSVKVLPGTEKELVKQAKELENRFAVTVSRLEKVGGKYQVEFSKDNSLVKIFGLENLTDVNDIRTVQVDSVVLRNKSVSLGTPVFAADIPGIQSAEITLERTGRLNAILECPAYDFATDSCPEWVPTQIPFTDNGTHVSFTVKGFSGYAGADITIINVYSHPTLGGNWTVEFNTTGYANLTITSVNGTNWSDSSESYDLRFLEIRCGSQILNYTWLDYGPGNGSVFVENYSCSDTGYEVSKVLTGGRHYLEFLFGNDTGYAYNTVFTCSSCTVCSQYLQNSSMSSGDTLQLTADLSAAGTCIQFNGKDNITLDCDGKKIYRTSDGDGMGINVSFYSNLDSDGITIQNCPNVSYFRYGIYMRYSNNSVVRNSSAFLNTYSSGSGVYVRNSGNITLTGVNTSQNYGGGYLYS
ncbi:MAG: hypothetical protein NTY20_03110, partial [Candidatus Aenigmarchaeota archaeon]|nr:hypothetical protein [Candidatus Aenigmarchaeota archaeon]